MRKDNIAEPTTRIIVADMDHAHVLAMSGLNTNTNLPGVSWHALPKQRNERDMDEEARNIAQLAGIGDLPLYVLRFLGRFSICGAESVILEVAGLNPGWQPQEPFFWSKSDVLEDTQRQLAESVLRQQLLPPPNRAPWEKIGWREQAMQWIDAEVQKAGMEEVREIVGKKTGSPWGYVVQVITQSGKELYFKAVRRYNQSEVSLCEFLNRKFPEYSPRLLAVNNDQDWMLMLSAGNVLREFGDNMTRNDNDLFKLVIQEFAAFQIETIQYLPDLVACGCPDRRFSRVSYRLDAALEEISNALEALAPAEIAPEWSDQLSRRISDLAKDLSVLDESDIPYTLVNMDFQPTNAAISPSSGNPVFFDWGEAILDFPFLSAFTFLRHPSVQALDISDELLTRYLQPFQQYAPLSELRHLFTKMSALHGLNEAWRWASLLSHVEHGTPMYNSLIREIQQFLHSCITPGSC